MFRRFYIGCLMMFFVLAVCFAFPRQVKAGEGNQAVILFTHDLHSHLLPANDENGQSYGGFARLMTEISRQRNKYPDAILVDGGDFSMGSLFQTVYAEEATELRLMGIMGYDATTFGNHEYDYQAEGLASMLQAAVASGDPLPAILESNYQPPMAGQAGYSEESDAVRDALEAYGVEDEYIVINRGGINYALFGLMGQDSHACAPMSGMILEDPVATARRIVEKIQAEVPGPCVVVCLSHCGTNDNPKKSEDEYLVSQVEGIDVIISGHSHTTLWEPVKVNDTYIVSGGEYGKYLGVLRLNLTGDRVDSVEYELRPINEEIPEHFIIREKVEEYKRLVEEQYLAQFGDLTFDQVIAYNPHAFGSKDDLDLHRESALGNLVADSYRLAVEKAEGDAYVPIDFALTVNGVLRESLPTGELTVSDVYNVLSLGIGADEVPGYPLVAAWITGKELKDAFEVDASITGLMVDAQLYYTGMEFTYNPNRMLFDKVTDSAQVLADGTRVEIEDEKLYRVVTGLYCAQMLGAVEEKSFGILSITPRDASGNAITDLEAYIVHDKDGNEIKEWYALASYLQDMEIISDTYSGPVGRKVADPDWNPIKLVANGNYITWITAALILIVILLVVLFLRSIARRIERRMKK